MWELDHKEGWVLKDWWFWTVVLEKTHESPLQCKEIKPDNPKGNQPWIFTGRTDGEAEAPLFWPPNVKSWLIREDPDAGKDWRQVEKGMTEDELVGWYQRLDGHESEQALGVGEGQGSLGAIGHWVTKSLTWQLKNNNKKSLERGCCSPIHSWFGLRMGQEEVLTRFYSFLQNSSPSFYSWNFFNAFIALD